MATPQLQAMVSRMTKDQLQRLVERYHQLIAQGKTPANDPETHRISYFLKFVQSAQQQQQQPETSQPSQQQQPQLVASSPSQAHSSPSQPQTAQEPAASSSSPSAPAASAAQQALVKCQELSYRCLSRNIPVPPDLHAACTDSQKALEYLARNPKLPQSQAIAATDPSSSSSSSSDAFPSKAIIPQPSAPCYPYNAYQTPIQTLLDSSAKDRAAYVMPTFLPPGIDPLVFQEERDRLIQARIDERIKQLSSLPSNLPSHAYADPLDNDESNGNSSQKLRALIELKSLRLLARQKQLREQVLKGYSSSQALQLVEDRNALRRYRRPHLRDARTTEHLEREQKRQRESRAKAKHLEHLDSIIKHGQSLLMAHRVHAVHAQKLFKSVQKYHSEIEKEEQKRVERISKERIKALRDDDEEGYLKLLGTAKRGRIHQLIKQTDQYLDVLAEAVRQQQENANTSGNALPGGGDDAIDESVFGAAPVFEEEEKVKVDYYNVAHRVKELVTAQPQILVGGTLKEYQIKGLQWMVSLYNNRLNGILADEMGLGKTIQTISLITYLIEKKRQNGPFLVIVPLSTIPNWVMEFERWAPSVRVVTYKGGPAARKSIQATMSRGSYQVVLTTYEYIIKDRPFLSRTPWIHMIIDEGHRLKNSQSKLSQTLQNYYKSKYRLILTGTPLQNNLPELWALLNFVLPTVFNSVKSFDEWFNTPFANTGGSDRIDLNEEEQLLIIRRLHKVLRPFLLRRLKRDVEASLPDKVERVIKCRMSALQSQLYKQIKDHGMVLAEEGIDTKSKGGRKLANIVMQLRKICNHPYVFDGVENAICNHMSLKWNSVLTAYEKDSLLGRVAAKFELLDRILPKLLATDHRVLMFFQQTRIMDITVDYLEHKGIKSLRLDGGTKHDERSGLLKEFNNPNSDYSVFLLSTRAGGLGLNLQTADTVIIYDSDWNPHQDLQAQDRAHRIGQKKEVRIFRLITAQSVEEHILARARDKVEVDKRVIQGGRFDGKSTPEEREEFLKSLLEASGEDEDDEWNGDMDDSELNDILARSEEELVVFAQIDRERKQKEKEIWIKSGRPGPMPPRLIEVDELPDVYRVEHIPKPVQEDPIISDEFGGRRRNKAPIYYDDGLKDDEFVAILEDESTDLREEVERRRVNKERRAANKYSNSSPRIAELSDEEAYGRGGGKRKRPGRKSEVNSLMASADVSINGDDDDVSRPTKKRRGGGAGAQPDVMKDSMKKMFLQIFDAIEDVTNEEYGYQTCGLFLDLPSKRELPAYYLIIKKPISMKQIRKKVNSKTYRSVDDFKADWYLMFENARTFNEEESGVYKDANILQNVFENKLAQLLPELNTTSSSAINSNNNSVSRSVSPAVATKTPLKKRSTINDSDESDDDYGHDDDDDDDEASEYGASRANGNGGAPTSLKLKLTSVKTR